MQYVCFRFVLLTHYCVGVAEHVAQMGQRRDVCRVLAGKPDGKRPLGRPQHRWEGNVKLDHQEMECGVMDWIELASV